MPNNVVTADFYSSKNIKTNESIIPRIHIGCCVPYFFILFFFEFLYSIGRSDRRRRRDGLSNFFHQQWAMRYYGEVKERRTEKNAHVCVCV